MNYSLSNLVVSLAEGLYKDKCKDCFEDITVKDKCLRCNKICKDWKNDLQTHINFVMGTLINFVWC